MRHPFPPAGTAMKTNQRLRSEEVRPLRRAKRKTRTELPQDPAILLPGLYQQDLEAQSRCSCTRVHSSVICSGRQVPRQADVGQADAVDAHDGGSLSLKRNEILIHLQRGRALKTL